MDDLLKRKRLEKRMTLEEVGELVGVGKSTVRKWENGMIENMGRDKIVALSKALDISPLDILGMEHLKESDISTIYDQLHQPRKRKVYSFAEHQLKEQNAETNSQHKIYNLGASAAGAAIEYTDDFVEEEQMEYIPQKANFILTIKGDSMEPEIKNGSKVFVQSISDVENGEIAIVEIDGDGVTCKKVKFDYDNQQVILQSLNPKYDDMVFNSDQIRILGRVIK